MAYSKEFLVGVSLLLSGCSIGSQPHIKTGTYGVQNCDIVHYINNKFVFDECEIVFENKFKDNVFDNEVE